MKYLIFVLFIKIYLCQIQKSEETNENKLNKNSNNQVKGLEINFNNIFDDTNIQIFNDDENNNEKKFILSQYTYIIYPSNNKFIEQYSSILAAYIKNNTGLEIGVTPNMAMKMTNKIRNNFIQLILDNTNNENLNDIVRIRINHRKILIKAKELAGFNQGINIINKLLLGNNLSNKTYDEIYFGPKIIVFKADAKFNYFTFIAILITFILIIFSFYILIKRRINS